MYMLRIEHDVASYAEWKALFDADPMDRRGSGVTGYRVMRADDAPDRVFVDLEFADADQATAMQQGLLQLWGRIDVIKDASVRHVDVVEAQTL